jgi:hypothetical protein
MTASKRLGLVLLAGAIAVFSLEIGDRFSIPAMHSFVSTAQAVVGRPLTPVSVAGVARRTARRCAAGVTC